MLTVLAAVIGILLKSYCRSNGWETPGQFYATCYSDFPELFKNRGLGDGAFPFITQGTFFEYPVLMGFIAGATALLVPGEGVSATRILAYFDINAALILAVWIVLVAIVAPATVAVVCGTSAALAVASDIDTTRGRTSDGCSAGAAPTAS